MIFNIIKKEDSHPVSRQEWTFGQKAADRLTNFAGSWTFIFIFFIFIFIWMGINVYFLVEYQLGNPFDPYPFILLNLILSCLAAIQAPVILMSQNRQGQKDRLRAEYDYKVNKKAEAEIRDMQKDLEDIKRLIRKKK